MFIFRKTLRSEAQLCDFLTTVAQLLTFSAPFFVVRGFGRLADLFFAQFYLKSSFKFVRFVIFKLILSHEIICGRRIRLMQIIAKPKNS